MDNENIQSDNTPSALPKKTSVLRKIIGVSIMVVLAGVITCVAILSMLQTNYNFNFNAPDAIEIHTSSSNSALNKVFVQKGSNQYEEIMKLYNNSFNSKFLTALFQGKSNQKIKVEEGYKSISSLSGPYLVFCYNSSQKLVLNGKEYKASIISDSNFIEIVIEVKNSTSLTEINAYFKYRDTGLNNYSYVRFSTLAVQSNLYEYIENL